MKHRLLALCMLPFCTLAAGPAYTPDGRLLPPQDYRQWLFLTSGLDMNYRSGDSGMHMFDNVFVEPEAWRAFQQTGTWPDRTVLVKEMRGARSKGSINRNGSFQTTGQMGVEVHVKDAERFGGGWAFFESDGKEPAQAIPAQAQCYSCHRDHGAVDNTFVQFYPTLFDIAEKKGTLSTSFMKENSGADAIR